MKNMNKNNKPIRQGDVLMIPVKSIPTGLIKTKKLTLAYGEVTGHHHTIAGNNTAIGYADVEDSTPQWLDVADKAVLVHQEHNPVVLDEGKYQVIIQSEYTPKEIKKVAD